MRRGRRSFRVIPVLMLSVFLVACGLQVGYKPAVPFLPVKFVLQDDGSIHVESDASEMVTPLGVFSLSYTRKLSSGMGLRAWLSGLSEDVAAFLDSNDVDLEDAVTVVFVDKSVPPARAARGFVIRTGGQPLVDQLTEKKARLVGKAYVVDITNRPPGEVASLMSVETAEEKGLAIEGEEGSTRQVASKQPTRPTTRVTDTEDEPTTVFGGGGAAEDLPTGLPPVTPPDVDFATNTPELPEEAVVPEVVVKTLRPTDPPEATVELPTNTPVPVLTSTMAPTATPVCVPAEGYPGPDYPGPDYPGPTIPPGCVTTTPVPVATFTPPPTNTSVPIITKVPRPTETVTSTATDGPPTLTPVPQVLPCATLIAGSPCRGGILRPSQINAGFSEACIVNVEGKAMLRFRLRLENKAAITLQGQAFPRARSAGNASAVLGGLSCMTGWRLQPGEVASLVGLVPLASRPPLGGSAVLEIRSRMWSCDDRSPRFISWEVPVGVCAVSMP